MKTRKFLYIPQILILLTLCATAAQAADPLTVGTVTAETGTAASGYLTIADGADKGTRIPISVIHGAHPGPVLALIAGVHGYEYPAITALQRLRKSANPGFMSGSVILVHIANPPSFLGRTIYRSPVDGKNLNRVFPGKADGSISERIADAITREVIDQADYLVDMHAGDGNEALMPYIYMPVTGDEALDARSRGLALAFGLNHIVIDTVRLPDPENSKFTDHTALTRGSPAITTETGRMGSNDELWVSMAERGVNNLMRHLGIVDDEEVVNDDVTWLKDYQVLTSPVDGIFRATVGPGDRVVKNTLIGVITDFFGDPVADVRAPFAGMINYVVGTPPVSEGEPVAMISVIVVSAEG